MTTFERLEAWHGGHKCRKVGIDIGDRYGATCWTVRLYHEHGMTRAEECSFYTLPSEKGGEITYRAVARAHGTVFAERDDEEDWAGLERTIITALDAFDAGVWEKREVPSTAGNPAGDKDVV